MEVRLKEGKYIYCIIEVKEPETFGPLGIGGRGDELYAICFGGMGAVVSNSPVVKYAVSRENTLAHEKAIETVMKEHTVLPVRFATIAEDDEKVRKILQTEHDGFEDLLNGISGKKELGLKAIFNEDAVYKEILEKYQDIKRLKEVIGSKPPEQTYYQRVEIGRMVEHALEKEKEEYKKQILDSLSPLAEDIRINNTYGEKMILNAAFLVNNDKEADFDRKVNELGTTYSGIIKFKYVGTVPPFNFVNLIIDARSYT
jgi:hypothetical protein